MNGSLERHLRGLCKYLRDVTADHVVKRAKLILQRIARVYHDKHSKDAIFTTVNETERSAQRTSSSPATVHTSIDPVPTLVSSETTE